MDLLCPALRAPFTEIVMKLSAHYGHAAVAGSLGAALLGHGLYFNNPRTRQSGTAVLAAFFAAAGVGEIVKHIAHALQPGLPLGYAPPSIRTGAAFGLASVLGAAFPGLGPLFFGLAVLTGISRLYLRAQTVGNVISGAVLGLVCGVLSVKFLLPRPPAARPVTFPAAIGWFAVFAFGAGALGFFHAAESNVAAHWVRAENDSATRPAVARLDFGAPDARPYLRFGWSADEAWNGGKRTVVWAKGLASELVLDLPAVGDYRVRFNAFPYAATGYACQRVEICVNEHVVAKVSLAKGWRWYQVDVPRSTVRAGRNFIQLYFDHAEAPKSRGRGPDERPLSAAFDSLQIWPITSQGQP